MGNPKYISLGIAFWVVGILGCKRMQENQASVAQDGTIKGGKNISVKIQDMSAPISPDHARVQLTVLRLLPDLAPAGNGPCSQKPCRAFVRADKVLGYGSSFQGALSEKQEVEMTFSMTLQKNEAWAGVQAGDVLVAEVQGPLLGGSGLTVVHYSPVTP